MVKGSFTYWMAGLRLLPDLVQDDCQWTVNHKLPIGMRYK